MKEFTTTLGWTLKSPPTNTGHGIGGFVLTKGNICSYIEQRRHNIWCCYKSFSEEYRSCKDGSILSIKGSPFKTESIDEAVLHLGVSREGKKEIVDSYFHKIVGI